MDTPPQNENEYSYSASDTTDLSLGLGLGLEGQGWVDILMLQYSWDILSKNDIRVSRNANPEFAKLGT